MLEMQILQQKFKFQNLFIILFYFRLIFCVLYAFYLLSYIQVQNLIKNRSFFISFIFSIFEFLNKCTKILIFFYFVPPSNDSTLDFSTSSSLTFVHFSFSNRKNIFFMLFLLNMHFMWLDLIPTQICVRSIADENEPIIYVVILLSLENLSLCWQLIFISF